MDTVSMLNKMRFYCQPILPLVYDESMSYYETLCKVVGQLNTTGDTVNKLNEGLTGEIADRQAADAALNERLKEIEEADKRTHFLVFDGANPNGVFPTRHELYQWVEAGDAIFTLFSTYEEGRGQIYAASCSYNAGNWGSEASNDFSIIVPLETTYDSTGKLAVKQKIVKLTIPRIPQTNLNAPWGLQIIEINTPHTSAEGVVNFTATVVGETVTANITPADFIRLFDAASATSKLCVGVNARLNYNALELGSSVATVYDNSSSKREVRITFMPDPHAGRRGYVYSEIFDIVNIVGDKDTNTWKIERFGTEFFDFMRYKGFQFTRKAGNVIEAADDCDPSSVAQYYNDLHDNDYQNLPVHLIDEVDNADYWNGTFDSYSDGRITFTFTTANYAAIGEKMSVRVIELSADANTTVWKYAEKEFTLPLSGGSAPTYVDFWGTGQSEVYDNGLKAWTVSLGTDKTFDYIFDLISSGDNVVARLYTDSTKSELVAKSIETNISGDKTLGNINFLFVHAATDVVFGFPTIADSIWVTKADNATSTYAIYKWCAIPVPAGDSADNGKVPIINGNKWELKTPDAGGVQSDWNQNDETQPDYVKHRPFYIGNPVETVLVEESTVTFKDAYGMYRGQLESTFSATVGETYKVSWDGTAYECACAEFSGTTLIGNLSIAGAGADTGEPFLIVQKRQSIDIYTPDTSASHTFSISRFTPEVVKIEEKYLPESAFTNAEWSKISNKIVDYKQQSLSLSVSGEQITIIAGSSTSKNRINDKLKFEDGMVYKINGSITIHSPSTAGGNSHTLYVNGNYTCSQGLVEFGSLYDNYYRKDIVLGLYSSSSDDTYYDYGYLYVSSALPGSTTWTFDINITVTGEAKPLPDICIGKNIQRVGDDVIISSSTPDSTKKFKITVDDSGTISATEVT